MTDFCDLVMKGGITSGVIYPRLIARLASRYQFKNIGGTSAGAIAAAACAAAQLGTLKGKPQAFTDLAGLPDLLAKRASPGGPSMLFNLFQPAPAARRFYDVLIRGLNLSPEDAVLAALRGMAGLYKVALCAGLVLGSLLLQPFVSVLSSVTHPGASPAIAMVMMLMVAAFTAFAIDRTVKKQTRLVGRGASVLLILVVGVLWLFSDHGMTWHLLGCALGIIAVALLFQVLLLLSVLVLFARGLIKAIHGNNYGICSGLTAQGSPDNSPGLTDWLTKYLNDLANRPQNGTPLTFGDLWGHTDPKLPRNINLEVTTTAISQQMVYGIPFREGVPSFYYDPHEWALLFPKSVMAYLNAYSFPITGLMVHSKNGNVLRRLPPSADLPVVVAVRMSLSFPLLLSAIPLYAIDWSRQASHRSKQEQKPVVASRVWFSDGGIGSNMPLHMFDSPLPEHPTFAINLKAEHPDHPIQTPANPGNGGGRIYLPDTNSGGLQRYWPEPDDHSSLGGLVGFFSSMINTMQSWRDEIMFTYPGFRDRILQISVRPSEGGLNLNMPDASIQALGLAGEQAADRLIDRFHPSGRQAAKGWHNHQKVRLETFLGLIQPASTEMEPSLSQGAWNSSLGGYGATELRMAKDILNLLQQMGKLQATYGISLATNAPKPQAQLKISPRI
ncbi:patatin-like phospholipase family protein [Pseudomonas moraviensis]|uniref:Putative acylesterase/phospholipase RssA n=1 Tax=Pseudomonas moraviensis TaxID=321662 RepID=A0A7Y9W0I6_9PSED|nr:patatin-like phospholipase family protein [Pseudomonas moraviensis]NYH11939.1 putative acylesterase/phospholipase RssA [Pseudomonas moraviensis]